jgi:MoaA/NifB/PqqE/SkfB family radical SAM enzyme
MMNTTIENMDTIRSNAETIMSSFAQTQRLSVIEDLTYFPLYIQIETVSICNARCVMCPVEEWTRDNTIMKPELFQKIVVELANYADWLERVTIQLDGEPLIDKQLENRIRQLKEIGIKCVAFSSNGSLMRQPRIDAIIQSGIDEVTFSIDGATAETFEAIRKPLKYDRCIKNIEEFIAARNRLNPQLCIRIRMAIQEANVNEFDTFIAFWQERLGSQDQAYGKLLHNWGNWLKGYDLQRGQDPETLNVNPCTSPFGSLDIFTDGRVPLCCSDYNAAICLGDVTKSSIKEIWNDDLFGNVRSMHLSQGRNGIGMCHNCNVWDTTSKIESI